MLDAQRYVFSPFPFFLPSPRLVLSFPDPDGVYCFRGVCLKPSLGVDVPWG